LLRFAALAADARSVRQPKEQPVTWFRGAEPGDTRPEIVVLTATAGLIALAATSELVRLLLGLKTVPVGDVVDTWEPSVLGTLILVPVQAVLLFLLFMFRHAAAPSTKRAARWSVWVSAVGLISLVLDHALVSRGVWGYLKLF
jgi:hypothetical protein